MGYPIRINICHWERSNAENPDTESVVSGVESTYLRSEEITKVDAAQQVDAE